MTVMTLIRGVSLAMLGAASIALSGCGKTASDTAAESEATDAAVTQVAAAEPGEAHSHGGWWCPEHGMPEEICTQCDSKLAAVYQEKGDWCEEHSRPESQCFICHPELEAKFAAQYKAKYGKEPPKPKG